MTRNKFRADETPPVVVYVHGDLDHRARADFVDAVQQMRAEPCLLRRVAFASALDMLSHALTETVHPGTLIVIRGGADPWLRKVDGLHPGQPARLRVADPTEHVLPLSTPIPLPHRGAA